MIKIEYIFCPAVGLYVILYRASMDSGHTSNHAVEHRHTYSPSSSSPVLLSQASSPTASDGKTRGNQPYSPKSTMNSPMAPRVTCTPSSLSAAAWFWAPSGWDLQPTAMFISMHQIAGNRHSPLPGGSSHRLHCRTGKQTYRGDMTPLELMTRCHGTLALLKRCDASLDRCFMHMPTCLGRCAATPPRSLMSVLIPGEFAKVQRKGGGRGDVRVPTSVAMCAYEVTLPRGISCTAL